MGAARLLARGWVVFCLFAAAHAIHAALAADGAGSVPRVGLIAGCALIFMAMGLLFAGGFGASSRHGVAAWIGSLRLSDFLPRFDDWVFLGFVALSFLNQILFAPRHITGMVPDALEGFIGFVVPGQHAYESALGLCATDSGQVFASCFAWLMAAIFLASASSRVELQAGIVRLERLKHPEALGPMVLASVLGFIALIGIQLLYVGSVYSWLPCSAFGGVTGALLTGLAPLMLAYMMIASVVCLFASGAEDNK